ncbi:ferrous iron transport protein B [Paenibacillus sp. UMB4589-SE434]|uniref:ferrous iron transport protein B n=1 Tax=Paenibacillus sp. UMB4589-SE434 TaxID=3046314 RepID=UPI0025505F71|nr:ferrous iron transport protein B [Paenibacillus sp. UMB4589-SE434]MDK8183055.1 ferrous iron transport protein B [Paenibacillus sp. UMB4589-SE434]
MSTWSTALVGNPNTGKTSLFNSLTRSYEYVGNWTGVTVEKKVGLLRNRSSQLIDLPGIYSLQPMSRDEGVAVHYLLHDRPNAMLNVVDASQLERNLFLTIQLLEYGAPMLIALNMNDVAEGRGICIKSELLEARLGIPVYKINARRDQGIPNLLNDLTPDCMVAKKPSTFRLDYGQPVETAIQSLEALLPNIEHIPSRWVALQYLENNKTIHEWVHQFADIEPAITRLYEETEQQLQSAGTALHLPQHIRAVRTTYIRQIVAESLFHAAPAKPTLTDRIDDIVTNRWLGIPFFIAVMYLMFKVTFEWIGSPLSDLLDGFLGGTFTDWTSSLLDLVGASTFTHALIQEGIIAGVGGVLVFVPQIFILFLFISFVEDSGYMARVTVVMDRLMEAVGLNGKAFIPFVIGFGCSVPGIMAARTIEQPRERLVTTLLVPFMSCSARLSVYALFAGVFFKQHQALVVLSLYLLGIVLTLILAKVFSKSFMKEEQTVFVVELPPYRMPQWRTLFRSTWEKGKGFIRKAGTFILGGSVLIWLLSYAGPTGMGVEMNESYLAKLGGLLAPLFVPLGFGTWQAGAALVTGFMAKEIVVSTMNIIYHAPDAAMLEAQIAHAFTPLTAYAFCAFVLLYVPCLATVGIIRREVASWKWTLFAMGYALVVAYLVALFIRLGGMLLGFA